MAGKSAEPNGAKEAGMQVEIKFRPFFKDAMVSGQKVMTCRSKKMGQPGDTFTIFDHTFAIRHVFRVRLRYVVSDSFQQQGGKSYQELIEIWKGIHPAKGYDPEEIVWAHCFRKQ